MKTKDRACKMGQNEPENEAEKSLNTNTCGKNEPEQIQKGTEPTSKSST
ncbi:MAG TPA: hypothetical protein VFC10_14845 [Terriglobia bacterium]|nr:hypothetical protein [Terriglobia bacterium]